MTLKRLLSLTRKAIDDYHMIRANDSIAIGLSGGKDSLTMLYALNEMRRFYPIPFNIHAITVDLGFSVVENDFHHIESFCKEIDVPFTIVSTNISQVVFDIRKETNPCSLCAKLRKGAFNSRAKELGCNKIAYAHHKDDFIETMMLSLIYEGRFYCFSPVTYLNRADLTLIRPLMYVDEADIIGFKKKYKLPVFHNPCPADGYTRRQYVKELLKKLAKDNPGCKERFFHAIISGGIAGWSNN